MERQSKVMQKQREKEKIKTNKHKKGKIEVSFWEKVKYVIEKEGVGGLVKRALHGGKKR